MNEMKINLKFLWIHRGVTSPANTEDKFSKIKAIEKPQLAMYLMEMSPWSIIVSLKAVQEVQENTPKSRKRSKV